MATLLPSKTLTISINRDASSVYDFASNPSNLPRWATAFCRSVKQVKGEWILETPQGPVTLRLGPKNALGVLDHYVSPSPGVEVFVPMRVVPNGPGSEVTFTLFRRPEMSEAQYAEDARLVEQDLATLKRIMEGENR